MKKYPCPYCKQNGFEAVYNHGTDEKENMECTGCWGYLWVSKGVYENYFDEIGEKPPKIVGGMICEICGQLSENCECENNDYFYDDDPVSDDIFETEYNGDGY